MPSVSDECRDVIDYLVPFIREAHAEARLVADFLHRIGVPPGTSVDPDLLDKIAALIRIHQWERTGLRPFLPPDLPSAREILEDIVGLRSPGLPRFSGYKLAGAVYWIAVKQLAQRPLADSSAPIAVAQELSPDQLLDPLARFLWQFRPRSDDPDRRNHRGDTSEA